MKDKDASILLVWAFRYGLLRSRGVVHDITEMLIKYSHLITSSDTELIIKEIEENIACGVVTRQEDIERWEAVRKRLKKC